MDFFPPVVCLAKFIWSCSAEYLIKQPGKTKMVFKTNVLFLNSLTLNCFSYCFPVSQWLLLALGGRMLLEFRRAPEMGVRGTEWRELILSPLGLQWLQQLCWQELLWVPRAPYGWGHLRLLICSPKRTFLLLSGQDRSKENQIQSLNYQPRISRATAVKNYLLYYLFSANSIYSHQGFSFLSDSKHFITQEKMFTLVEVLVSFPIVF